MSEIPKEQKKCVRCGAPAEYTFVDVKDSRAAGEQFFCSTCAMKEGFFLTAGAAGRFALLVQALEHEKKAGGDTSQILECMRKVAGEDLPDDPAVWRRWMREYPEKAALSDDDFYNVLSESGIRFFDSSHRGRAEFLVALLEYDLKRGEDVSRLVARMKELTGKDLPAEPEAWREWIGSDPAGIRIDVETFAATLTEMGMMHSLGPYDGLTKKINPQKPFGNS